MPKKEYNHRMILDNEIIIEYDDETPEQNRKLSNMVTHRLRKYGVGYAKWDSGNKSYHVHTLLNMKEAKNTTTLKRVFMRFFGTFFKNIVTGDYYYEKEDVPKKLWNTYVSKQGAIFETDNPKEVNFDNCKPIIKRILPDMKLACSGHLIRMEYGIHEKTQKTKRLLGRTANYPFISEIPKEVWENYNDAVIREMKRRTTQEINRLDENPIVKNLLNSVKFRDIGDGRERLLFAFIHIFKPKYKEVEGGKEELTKYLYNWYHYSEGHKLTYSQIRGKVNYHWNRDYKIGINYIMTLCEDLGVDINTLK